MYRAWSHWRALSGSKHIQFLLERNLIKIKPSPILDTLYFAGIMRAVRDRTVVRQNSMSATPAQDHSASDSKPGETMLLDRWNSKLIAKALKIPELEAELGRAIWQVERVLKGREEFEEEKQELEKETSVKGTQTQEHNKR